MPLKLSKTGTLVPLAVRLVKPRRKFSWVGATLYTLFALAIGAGASLAGWANHNAPIMTKALVTQALSNRQPEDVFKRPAMNLLILGCDDEFLKNGNLSPKPGRSDMMMLVRFDFKQHKLTGLSIPRDTVMRLPSYDDRSHKINVYHARGGPELAAKAVESLLKVKVDRVARLNFVGFVDAVNLLGGVQINAKKQLEYTDRSDGLYIRIKKGLNDLNGYGALGFVRFRHDDSDFARQERQHEFVAAMRAKMVAKPTLALKVTDRLLPLLNGAFNADEMASLIRFGIGLKSTDIMLGGVPTQTMAGVMTVNRKALPQTLNTFGLSPELGDPSEGSLDGSAVGAKTVGDPDEEDSTDAKLSVAPHKDVQTHVNPDH